MRRRQSAWTSVAAAALAPVAVGALLTTVADTDDQTNVAFAFLLLVLVASAYGRGAAGIAASVSAFLTFNYFFIEPTRTLTVSTRRDGWVLAGFLTVAIVVSSLVDRIDRHRERAERQAEDAQLLFALNVSLSDVEQPGQEMREVAGLAQSKLGFRAVAVVHSAERDEVLHSAGVPEPLLRLAVAGGAGDAVVAAAPLRHGGTLRLIAYSDDRVDDRRRELLVAFAARAAAAAERRAAQDERERMAVLQETDRQRAALLSSVSHDLRTPLAGIKLSAAALATSASADERDQLARSVVAEVDRLDRMVRNVLDLSRVERGILKASREDVPVDDLVGTVLSRLRSAIGDRELVIDVPGDLPAVSIDFVQVEQALTNVVENALQHSPATAALTVSAAADDGWVTVRVADAGGGIAPEERERIFRSFERGRSARAGGSGLGLAIARAFTAASGGSLELAHTATGTAFDLRLPAVKAAQC